MAQESQKGLPGFGLPVDYETPNFETAIGGWTGAPLTVRERDMLALMDALSDKPEWRRKVFDEEIVAKWRAEALARPNESFSEAMFDYCIAELRDKAGQHQHNGMVVVYDSSASVVKSDSTVSEELRRQLLEGVRPLEDVSENLKDWHPGSDDKVLDLVHPSLFPLIYGQSRILPDTTIGLDDCMEKSGSGVVVPKPELKGAEWWSAKYQWLPCDVSFSEDGSAKIVSYINNLHPVHHRNLYPIIEKFIEKSVPLWQIVLDREDYQTKVRIETYGSGFEEDLDDMEYPRQEGDPESDSDEYWDIADEWKRNHRVLQRPDPDPYKSREVKRRDPPLELLETAKKNGLQVIVKLANIHLSPDQGNSEAPRSVYTGGSWHVEGMLNENIRATALYYYDEENITDSHLAFRQACDHEDLVMKPPQSDFDGLLQLYNIEQEGPAIQEIGQILTRQGRLLAFPNVMQHRVSPFELADKTKPGHRKILALFLIDPTIRIISTANIPPQQRDWWAELAREKAPLRGLPAETFNNVVSQVEFPISMDDAKEIRLDLMEERKRDAEITNDRITTETFFFCEH